MRVCSWIRSVLFAGLLVALLPVANASAVSVGLVPQGPTTFGVGETLTIDIFLNRDAGDPGIDGMSFQLLWDFSLASVTTDPTGSIFGPNQIITPVPGPGFVAFSGFGNPFSGASGRLGSITLTGLFPGGVFSLETRRVGTTLPSFTNSSDNLNRFNFDSVDALTIEVVPEPGTLVLLGASLAGLAFLRRRRSV